MHILTHLLMRLVQIELFLVCFDIQKFKDCLPRWHIATSFLLTRLVSIFNIRLDDPFDEYTLQAWLPRLRSIWTSCFP